jgi:hypothetical protein
MPEIEAQGGERILASPTEACPCKTFLAHFPYCTHFDFRILPDLAHLTFSSEKAYCLVYTQHIDHMLFDVDLVCET